MLRFLVRAAAAAAAVLAMSWAAFAQDEDAVYAAFGAYQQALQAGDAATAAAKAEEAWRLAEDLWGDHENTAVLAYNYASYLFNSGRRAEAAPPAERAADLADAGYGAGQVPVRDAKLIAALADFSSGERAAVNAARKRLDALLETPSPATPVSAVAHLEMARDCVANSLHKRAMAYAAVAENELGATLPDARGLLAEALLFQAIGQLYEGDPAEADRLIHRARGLFHTDEDRDVNPELTPLQYQLQGWQKAVEAFAETKGLELDPGASGEAGDSPVKPNCLSWEDRKFPDYPREQAKKGNVGAAVISFDVQDDGSLEDIKVRAAIGGSIFGETAERAVRTWRAIPNPDAGPACRINHTIEVIFILEDSGGPRRIR